MWLDNFHQNLIWAYAMIIHMVLLGYITCTRWLLFINKRDNRNHIDCASIIYIICVVNTLRPRQNDRHFADDTFNRIFLNENVRISFQILLKFVPKGPINNIPALVQIMAWRQPGDKPLSEPMMTQFNDVFMRHSASMSWNEPVHITTCLNGPVTRDDYHGWVSGTER